MVSAGAELVKIFILLKSVFFLLLLLRFRAASAFTTLNVTGTRISVNNDELAATKREQQKLGSPCSSDQDCRHLENTVCDENVHSCQCNAQYSASNGLDKCAKGSPFGSSCSFDEQCEYYVRNSMCRNGICTCRGNGKRSKLADGSEKCEGRLYGDPCQKDEDCGFKTAICYSEKCDCPTYALATNHIDKCGKPKKVNEECFFNEQCEYTLYDTVCLNAVCQCKSERNAVKNADGSVECTAAVLEETSSDISTDPTMIIVLSVMVLMFIIICVVLHLFSKARWRENRTIFNTPNSRLMNVSLIREKNKQQQQQQQQTQNERRGSKDVITTAGMTKGGLQSSRDSSMASLKQHSPSTESKSIASRRESKGAASNGSTRSPTSKSPAGESRCFLHDVTGTMTSTA